MKLITIIFLATLYILTGCSGNKLEEKGFAVSPSSEGDEENRKDGISNDSLTLQTRPSNVLLTGNPRYRLATIYKVNYKINYGGDSVTFIGSNDFHYLHREASDGNQWNYNLMPGLASVYGYNLVNISHYDTETQTQSKFFQKPVLIKTLYYPSFSKDTLNYKPVNRNYFMISVYDEDTNKDGYINIRDLRRFYCFDIHAQNKKALVPPNYSVMKSEYDPANDFMYVFAQLDSNANGQNDDNELIHVFWIDLKNPDRVGRQY
jgi:hypothetical protein